jgi:glycine cleavage system transcriptional repressor
MALRTEWGRPRDQSSMRRSNCADAIRALSCGCATIGRRPERRQTERQVPMRTDIVLTLTGPDRVGIVEEVTRVLLELEANVGTGRMARLGGEFAILMQASLPEERLEELCDAFNHLIADGYRVTTNVTVDVERRDWLVYRVDVSGADHEGIVHGIARGLSQRGINIESMETGTVGAPVSGTPLFFMSALVAVPPELAEEDWVSQLESAADQANVDVSVSSAGSS